MQNINRKLCEKINKVLKPLGFKKKGVSWYLNNPQTITILEIQRSKWSENYYLNLGIYLKEKGEEVIDVQECKCHIRTRLTKLLDNKSDLEKYLNYAGINDTEILLNIDKVEDILKEFFFRNVENFEDVESVVNYLMLVGLGKFLILKSVAEKYNLIK